MNEADVDGLMQPMIEHDDPAEELRIIVRGTIYAVRWTYHRPLTICTIVWRKNGTGPTQAQWGWAQCNPWDEWDAIEGKRHSARRALEIDLFHDYPYYHRHTAFGADRRELWAQIRTHLYLAHGVAKLTEHGADYGKALNEALSGGIQTIADSYKEIMADASHTIAELTKFIADRGTP